MTDETQTAAVPSKKAATKKPAVNPFVKMALELGPLVIFFFVNARGDRLMDAYPQLAGFGEPIFLATAIFMVAITISLILSRFILGKLPMMPLVSGVLVLFFGALTLWLNDDLFIKLKPTIVNMMFATALLGGLWIFRVSLLSYVFDDAFNLKEEGWRILTQRWGLFFVFLAVINEVVWRTQTTDFWVAFKVWGVMPLTFVFAMAQIGVMSRYGEDDGEEDGEESASPAE